MPIDLPTPVGRALQLFVWHAEQRFLFIAAGGGTHDLVKEQPISDQTLEAIKARYRSLVNFARILRRGEVSRDFAFRTLDPDLSTQALGRMVRRLILHPDIRDLLVSHRYSEIAISTNEYSIPWELMASNGSFLSLDYSLVRRLQTARPIAQPTRILHRENLKALLVSDPTNDLPESQKEARAISALLMAVPASVEMYELSGAQCARLEVLRLLTEVDVFHFAGHAFFDNKRPKESGLILNDGRLLASEIENYLGRSAPALVFLNACESSAFASADLVISGQEMVSLAHPFINAGSSAVIGAALPVGDMQASRFATNLYERFAKGESLGASVRRARLVCAKEFGLDDPTWSSFILFGDSALRVIIDVDKDKITTSQILSAFKRATQWLRHERAESGHWCDRVYRDEGPINVAEVVLCFDSTGEPMTGDELDLTIKSLLSASSSGFSAYPYEPSRLGPFTSCVALVIRALLRIRRMDDLPVPLHLVERAISESVEFLLKMQDSSGGWSWGGPTNHARPYTLFTVEALDALEESLVDVPYVDQTRLQVAINAAHDYIRLVQRPDGGWGFQESIQTSDPASTCYAATKLLEGGALLTDPVVAGGLDYLRTTLDFSRVDDTAFYIDHRIELAGEPQGTWPHFEDYSGSTHLCLLLATAPAAEAHLGTSGLLGAIVKHLLKTQDHYGGWPQRYSTIYVTSFVLQTLAMARETLTIP